MSRLYTEARKYLGVKFRHRGRSEKALDCAGLAWIAFRDCGVVLPDFRLYGKEPHENGLIVHIANALGQPVSDNRVAEEDLRDGDVAVFRFKVEPHHVGIIGPYPYGGFSMIHACGASGRVVEHRLSQDMVNRITHVFRRPV